ncbi:hypothetical protein GWK47_005354 [Chionoecetes opilio]|uniref:Uncharacterized protein n=1 Tax=Chionoecetes opilio TaxID=41210 RepID=A0A8J5CZA1_CHIOP|nr:hypothetical protein GWK47_005354 [Chionoecetes opilio]
MTTSRPFAIANKQVTGDDPSCKRHYYMPSWRPYTIPKGCHGVPRAAGGIHRGRDTPTSTSVPPQLRGHPEAPKRCSSASLHSGFSDRRARGWVKVVGVRHRYRLKFPNSASQDSATPKTRLWFWIFQNTAEHGA